MEERNPNERKLGEEVDLEKRLTAYYGPALSEQPLSQASWERLRGQMDVQHPLKRRFHLSKKRSESAVPTHIRETFARIAYQASVAYVPARLRCTFRSGMHVPRVYISPLDRRSIKLVLPSTTRGMMSQAELDVLLATGLARYVSMQRPGYILIRLLLLSIALLVSFAAVMFSIGALRSMTLLMVITIGVLLGLAVLWLFNKQRRLLAFRADELMVGWLGRSHVCHGLHALADSHRVPHRLRWGEPSLEERIERVCGTQVEVGDPRLTMVR